MNAHPDHDDGNPDDCSPGDRAPDGSPPASAARYDLFVAVWPYLSGFRPCSSVTYPRFTLRGPGVDYRTETVEIGASFLYTTVTDAQGNTYDEYDGAAVLKAKVLTVSAIGSYAYLDGHPSFFIYAALDYPIGGPAFFFVTGPAAGLRLLTHVRRAQGHWPSGCSTAWLSRRYRI